MSSKEKNPTETLSDFNPHAKIKCCLCGREIEWWQSNNPWPIVDDEESRCCGDCNANQVIPARTYGSIRSYAKKG